MALTRRSFLRNLGVLASAIGVGLTIVKPQSKSTKVISSQPKNVIQGYKGSQFIECGIIYAPYIPLIQTCNIVEDNYIQDFSKYYKKVSLTNSRNMLQLS